MKIIKTIALASLILVSSRFVSCFNPDEPSRKSFIEIVINGVIENIVKAEQDLGENVDSIFIVCNNPIVIIDSSIHEVGSFDCNNLLFSNSRIRSVEKYADFHSRKILGKLNDYYLFEFDSITIGTKSIVAKSTVGTVGTRLVYKFTFDRDSLTIVHQEVLEIMQY